MATSTATAAGTQTNRFIAYLADYASYHKSHANEITHHIGIPMIEVAIFGLFAQLQFGPSFAGGLFAWDVGFLGWIVVSLWYISMDWKIGIPSSIVTLGVYALGRQIPIWGLVALFVLGWVIQFIGHVRYEKNRPAFFKNFEHLLIGPIWIFGKWFRYLPSIPGTEHR